MLRPLLCLLLVFAVIDVSESRERKLAQNNNNAANENEGSRNGRLFSLFNIVQFKQDACTSKSDPTMSGTCMTGDECAGASGTANGNCASGFGVCCMFTANCGTGVPVTRNTQYPLTAAPSTTCSYTFNRICPNLCQIRLDFVNLVTATPPTSGSTTGTCADTVTALGGNPASIAQNNPPVVCGTLTGQHMYLETGPSTNANAGSISIAFGAAAATTRTYKIKVTYFTCDSTGRLKAPAGCVQYFTGTSGTIQSYNFAGGSLLNNQNYQSCVRKEQGFCSVNYRESGITTPDPFGLIVAGAGPTAGYVGMTSASGLQCTMAQVIIPSTSSQSSTTLNKYCGASLSSMTGQTTPSTVNGNVAPFFLRTFTNYGPALKDASAAMGATIGLTGYSLDYSEVPC